MGTKKILVIEDSPMVLKIIRHVLSTNELIAPVYGDSLEAAKSILEQNDDIFAAVVDLNLPDAPDGEIVDLLGEKGVPTIVLTGSVDDKKREKILGKGIVDYVLKEGKYSYVYVDKVLRRLIKNQDIKVLVVDDSSTARKFVVNLLKKHLYDVVEAADGVDAIKAILGNPDINMLITDYHMPQMDGFQLIKTLRTKYEKSELVIIGVSSEGDGGLSAKFIKNGASDFLKKPFNHEEFYCRVTHNVELLEMVDQIRDLAYRDEMTGIHNRKYFFEKGLEIYKQAQDSSSALAAAVIDFDRFRFINERFGNDAGDTLIIHFSQMLQNAFSRFLFARTGGQEFFVLMPGLDEEKALEFVNRVRELLHKDSLEFGGEKVGITISAGVSGCVAGCLDDLLSKARVSMKRAKEAGGDLVMGDDDAED